MDDIDRFLQEDLGEEGDITSDALFSDETATAHIIAKEACVVAGLEEAQAIFTRTGATTNSTVHDGDSVHTMTPVLKITGPVRAILKGERLALNVIGRMSGIATETKRLVNICRKINPKVRIAATRKTTPGFRQYEKKAVMLGGGEPHRFGLFDAVMIKDNHLKCVDTLEQAIRMVQEKTSDKIIEVEVENEQDALIAANMNVDVIMLDNFQLESGQNVAEKIRKINPRILIELSGRVTPENITDYAAFADRISLGYLTHSIKNRDFSLEIT